MGDFTREEIEKAILMVSSFISRCEKMEYKFKEGTPQNTLLKNRIKALYISKSLLTGEAVMDKYTKEELEEALPPVSSIINKCETAQKKFEEGSANYSRFENMIQAINVSKSLILSVLKTYH